MVSLEERVKDLMRKPERIRNICIAAHIDHGKCISPSARVCLWDGRFVEAEKLFNSYKSLGKIVKSSEDETVVDVSNLNIYVNSFSRDDGRIVRGKITHLWKLRKTEPLVEVEVENGRKIKTTPEHKYFVLDREGNIAEKKAEELKEGDVLVLANYLDYAPLSLKEMKKEILDRLSRDYNFCVKLREDFAKELWESIKRRRVVEVWKKIGSKIGYRGVIDSWKKGVFRLFDYLKLCSLFNLSD